MGSVNVGIGLASEAIQAIIAIARANDTSATKSTLERWFCSRWPDKSQCSVDSSISSICKVETSCKVDTYSDGLGAACSGQAA